MDVERFDPAKADRDAYPGEIKVLYAGRLSREKGVDLLADAFLARPRGRPAPAPAAGRRRPRGGGAARAARRRRHLPRLARRRGPGGRLRERRRLPLLQRHRHLRPGDPRGRAPAGCRSIAIAEGGPAALVENRHTGLLCRPDADHVAGSLLQLAASPELRAKLGSAGARAARARSWERSMSQLAAGYRLALDGAPSPLRRPDPGRSPPSPDEPRSRSGPRWTADRPRRCS